MPAGVAALGTHDARARVGASAQLVREALDRLPEVQRRALEATYLSDQTAAQAARRLDVPVGTVKSRVFYGLRMLRSVLDAGIRERETEATA